MSLLVSSWSNGIQSVPKDYVMPPERRPGDVSVCKEIPVIDLQENPNLVRSDIARQIIKALQEFGSFQVINHGVPETLMKDVMVLYEEFFNLPTEDKVDYYSDSFGSGCTLFTSGLDFKKEEVHYWRDTLKHAGYPVDQQAPTWPKKPARYRELVGKYVVETRKMAFNVLGMIEEGLGLKRGSLDQVSQEQLMAINYYPQCPDPNIAMGLADHTDPNLLTFLQQDKYGLQICKDGKWIGVEPIPNAFVVMVGCAFEIVTNGKIKSTPHRAVTNSTVARTSIGSSLGPNISVPVLVEPAKELVTSSNPQKFKPVHYNEFLVEYFGFHQKPPPHSGTPLDPYLI